jgi:hypothetical protein
MPDPLDALSSHVHSKLKRLRSVLPDNAVPSLAVVRQLLGVAFYASLRTEEGRFLRASITFANPHLPHVLPPCVRNDYPHFTPFAKPKELDARSLAKLSRAIDPWTASIAVFGSNASSLHIWGIVDQAVGSNLTLYREKTSGFSRPGIVTINVQGVGELSAYHGSLFLGGVRQDEFISAQTRGLDSSLVQDRILPRLAPYGRGIYEALPSKERDRYGGREALLTDLFAAWAATVARLCIGSRRHGTGGTFLLTDTKADASVLRIGHLLSYTRLGSAVILGVLDKAYHTIVEGPLWNPPEFISFDMFGEEGLARGDLEDRTRELTGAVKLVSSLASLDGATVLSTTLELVGFGAKIDAPEYRGEVFDGPSLASRRTVAARADIRRLGTRHGSAMRFAAWDQGAIALVVSQDGDVRMFLRHGNRMAFWDNISVMGDSDDLTYYLKMREDFKKGADGEPGSKFGYTDMPKSLAQMMRKTARRR